MTIPDTRPCVPPVKDGIFKMRCGSITERIWISRGYAYAKDHSWELDGAAVDYNDVRDMAFDLVELMAVAIPVAELEQLRRASRNWEWVERNFKPIAERRLKGDLP